MVDAVVTAGATRRAKLQTNHHHQQTNTQSFFTGQMPFLSPNQQCQSTERKYQIPWTCLPQAHLWVFEPCLWPLKAPGYLGGGLTSLSSALWRQYQLGLIPAVNNRISSGIAKGIQSKLLPEKSRLLRGHVTSFILLTYLLIYLLTPFITRECTALEGTTCGLHWLQSHVIQHHPGQLSHLPYSFWR